MKKKTLAGALAFLMLGATIVADQYDVLFLKCNGTTTTFVDSSTANPKTITANGNATQLPIKFNKSAGFFNGTTDYVVVPDSADLDFGTNNFTVEWFENRTDLTALKSVVVREQKTYTPFAFGVSDATNNTLYLSSNGSGWDIANAVSMGSLNLNTWNHFAVTRNGNNFYTFKNGTLVSTFSSAGSIQASSAEMFIGKLFNQASYGGWLKELRISKVDRSNSGASFTVPTTQYQSDANTVLLMHFDTPATSPLAPAIAFDGTGDYLDFSDSADFAPGTGAFTVEGFLNTGVPATAQTVYDTRTATANTTGFLINIASSKLCFTTATTARITGGTTLIANRTYHWRVVGNGGADGARTVTLYLNGQVEGTAYTNNYSFTDQTLRIGSIKAAAGTAFNGWMREIRVSNNERNTTAFTPSQTGWAVDANTKLYIKGDENNGVGGNNSTDIKDSSTSPKTVTCINDTKIKYTEDYRSCIFKDETGKFPYPVGSAKVDFFAIGSGVGYFDGSGDYLTVEETSSNWQLNGTAFSIEGYVNLKNVTGVKTILDCWYEPNPTGWRLEFNNDSIIWYTEATIRISQSGFKQNTWYHICVCGDGVNVKLFINGVFISTVANNPTNSSRGLTIGTGSYGAGGYYFNGLLDNIRISKGVARYTATFNPPADFVATGSSGRRKTNWFWFF